MKVREPAVILAVVASFIQLMSVFLWDLTPGQQGLLNGVAVAVAGVITGLSVSVEKGLPMLVGLAQALIAVGVGFGVHWLTADAQTAILSLVTTVVALFVRGQVTASVGPKEASLSGVQGVAVTRQTGGSLN